MMKSRIPPESVYHPKQVEYQLAHRHIVKTSDSVNNHIKSSYFQQKTNNARHSWARYTIWDG